jgi:quinol monooxygenase YgiN
MIIISGAIKLQPGQRNRFLQASAEAMRAARNAPGCGAFVVAADPIEADVANVYEEWDAEEFLLKFRGEGPSADMRGMIASANVRRHYISMSGPA